MFLVNWFAWMIFDNMRTRKKMFLVNWFPWMIFANIETERIWLNITKETLLIYNKKKTFLSKGGKSKNVLQSSRSHKIRYKSVSSKTKYKDKYYQGEQEADARRCSGKTRFFEISQNSQNTCARAFLLIKLQASPCNFVKKANLAQVFSCEFWETSKSTFSYWTSLVAASGSKKAIILFKTK